VLRKWLPGVVAMSPSMVDDWDDENVIHDYSQSC
jgi:hypothetical protein